jgi:hypothetical protein
MYIRIFNWWSYILYSRYIYALRTQYCAGDNIENEMSGACSAMGEGTSVYMVLVGKPKEKSDHLETQV